MKHVYIVTVRPTEYIWEKVSQECYTTLSGAQFFIEHRSDKPVRITPFKYQGELNSYSIQELTLIDTSVCGCLEE